MKDHISVCIPTFRRNEMLECLLRNLAFQETRGLFDFSVVVVDNDARGLARDTVMRLKTELSLDIIYDIEPEQNIALARNKAVKNAKGNFIAFIDDDEFPNKNWLLNLYRAINYYKSDGILGPVLPYFEKKPPIWVLKGGFFDRPSHPTGHILVWQNTRTGNALLRKELFKEDRKWFDPAFGSGGEDRDFFKRKIAKGHVFIWCNEAPVYEIVPPSRWRRTILLKRALLRGKMAVNVTGSRPASVLKSAVAVVFYTLSLPLFIIVGHHIFMKYLIKNFDHLGKVLAFLGMDLVKEKYV